MCGKCLPAHVAALHDPLRNTHFVSKQIKSVVRCNCVVLFFKKNHSGDIYFLNVPRAQNKSVQAQTLANENAGALISNFVSEE